MKRVNKTINVSLVGGIIGALGNSPKQLLQNAIEEANNHGWHVKQVVPASSGSFLYGFLRFLVLILTLFFYTFDNGYYIILEKEVSEKKDITSACPICKTVFQIGEQFCSNCGHKISRQD